MIMLLFLALQVFAADDIIKSKDDIVFHTPDIIKFSDAGKISEFRGVIDRVYFNSHDLKMIDLYQFNTETLKVSDEFCTKIIEKIFAVSKSRIFQVKSFKIIESNKGKVCEVLITDKEKPKKKEKPYLRFATIGFINAKANTLVYHPIEINDDKITEARQFWNNLR